MHVHVRIKICCISSVDEAAMAVFYGAAALGLVSKMPSGPGVIADELIATIVRTVPPPVATFLLTSSQSAASIIAAAKAAGVTAVQLVDELLEGSYDDIRLALPYIKIVQVIHVTGEFSISVATSAAIAGADALLLDSGNPQAAIKTLGGTGNTHNWSISRAVVEAVTIPVFLAGGLHAGNINEAIAVVRPFGVDVCSGVRSDGKLDWEKLQAFVSAVSRQEIL